MPADYKSTAAGLSISSSSPHDDASDNKTLSATSAAAQLGGMDQQAPFRDDDGDSGDSDAHDDARPAAATQSVPWARPANPTRTSNASRRLSTPYSRSSSTPLDIRSQLTDFALTTLKTSQTLYHRATTYFVSLNPTQQFLVLAGAVVLFALTITLLIFSQRIFHLLGPVATSWRAMPGGWLLVWLATFLVAFPPLIGYSTACTVAGFVYGFPLGWPIVATATVAGSTAAFIASRTVLAGYVDGLVGHDKRFVALGQVLRHDGLGVLALVRFCPLPYSLSNGFLATVPSIAPASFALATAFASPKLLVHVFIGSRLALLAEKGDEMGFGDRLVNYVSMLVGACVGMGVGYFIYRRTMARAAELAREEGGGVGAQPLVGEGAYEDDAEAGEGAHLMNPDDAAALMVDADDISLWDAAGDEDWNDADGSESGHGAGNGRYRDEEEAVGGDGGGAKRGDSQP
ncbi:Tlg2-vesicle protein [Gnomoniopsis smithogilvyi]|uniref:Golgi apparatus membrane protein TVP38 n=1 Tax=Gnomoniopsis smithogilvyi TaxID=1191159 RepID=A0A9W9D207_9PEZI|nr:Tlg2-vesicle protein [Gnomoniopsis smithogilvyi]